VLQIVTKMYFREDAPVSAWPHRMVLYTNCSFLTADPIELPVGALVPSTPSSAVSAVMASVTEHLETARSEEQLVTQIATGGRELIDDLAVVLSFGLNAVFSRDLDLVRRLVPDAVGTGRQTRATHLFGRTCRPTNMSLNFGYERLCRCLRDGVRQTEPKAPVLACLDHKRLRVAILASPGDVPSRFEPLRRRAPRRSAASADHPRAVSSCWRFSRDADGSVYTLRRCPFGLQPEAA
jgi:hypothetical protein